jgi:hypothetical protein
MQSKRCPTHASFNSEMDILAGLLETESPHGMGWMEHSIDTYPSTISSATFMPYLHDPAS